MSWAMFGFAMARKGTMVLRIAWATRPNNGSVALAANIFAFLGVVVIYIVVLLLSLRVFRARQPRLGWKPWLSKGIKITYAILLVLVLVVVPFTIVNGFSKDPQLQKACTWIIRVGVLYFFLFNLIAPILYLLAIFLPRPKDIEPENFGTGCMQTKLVVLAIVIFFTVFISAFRLGVTWAPIRSLSQPAWYDTRAAFYTIELGFELIITFTLISVRFDRRFWIPNGSKRPGDYSSVDLDGSEHKSSQLEHMHGKVGSTTQSSMIGIR
jgi:hypothetical protein